MKKVIYTAAIGPGYFPLKPETNNPEWDHICFTDRPIESKYWSIKIIDKCKEEPTNQKTSRKPKILNDQFLPEYDLSIYLDNRFTIRYDLNSLVNTYLKNNNIAMMKHHKRNCIYKEAEYCIANNIDNKSVIKGQMKRYKSDGFPENYGLTAGGIIIRRHNIPEQKQFMYAWFDEILKGSWRDQLSFNYILWKYPLNINHMPFKKIYNDLK